MSKSLALMYVLFVPLRVQISFYETGTGNCMIYALVNFANASLLAGLTTIWSNTRLVFF